jgi:hypothetical protein
MLLAYAFEKELLKELQHCVHYCSHKHVFVRQKLQHCVHYCSHKYVFVRLTCGSDMIETMFHVCRVAYPNNLTAPIEADSLQKLIMKFALKDKNTGKLMTVHQAFVKLQNHATSQEIIFVAEPDSAKMYKFDIVSNACIEFVNMIFSLLSMF